MGSFRLFRFFEQIKRPLQLLAEDEKLRGTTSICHSLTATASTGTAFLRYLGAVTGAYGTAYWEFSVGCAALGMYSPCPSYGFAPTSRSLGGRVQGYFFPVTAFIYYV